MANNGLLVTISGAALSLLYYENLQNVGDQMGFLIGEVLTYVTKNVTDDDRQIESTEIHVDIQGVLPCPSSCILYNSIGKINEASLEDLIGNKKQEIVGWYRFRLNNSLTPTFRDKIILKELEKIFCRSRNEKTFVTCMLNYGISDIGGTHKFRHVFLHYKDGLYQPIPLRINNLGADASRHDGSDYKPTPTRVHNSRPNPFNRLLSTIELNPQMSGIEKIITIQKAAENHLEKLIPALCESENEIALLEHEISELRAALRYRDERQKRNQLRRARYSCGEPNDHMLKRDNEQYSNSSSSVSASKSLNKSYDSSSSEFITREVSIAMDRNNACQSDESDASPSRKISYSEAMKKSPQL